MSQSARERASAELRRPINSSLERNFDNASLTDFSSSALSKIRLMVFLCSTPSSFNTSSTSSCPSRSGSPAFTISSASLTRALMTPNCFFASGFTFIFQTDGMIGKSSMRQWRYFSLYSSGAYCSSMCPKHHVTMPFFVRMQPPLSVPPPRPSAMALPRFGFSAMYSFNTSPPRFLRQVRLGQLTILPALLVPRPQLAFHPLFAALPAHKAYPDLRRCRSQAQ